MAKKLKIKTGDTVRVVAGNQKGKEGKVVRVFIEKNRAIVEGVGLVSKHTKPSTKKPQGGIVKKEASLHISNLMILEGGNMTRVGYRLENDKKIRFSKRSNKAI